MSLKFFTGKENNENNKDDEDKINPVPKSASTSYSSSPTANITDDGTQKKKKKKKKILLKSTDIDTEIQNLIEKRNNLIMQQVAWLYS